MNDEKLITLVERNECIYNKLSPDFKNTAKKKYVWANISKEMGFPEDACIRRWTSLRDRYTKEKRAENLPSGSGSKYKCPWPFLSLMEFLGKHIIARPTRGTTNILDEFRNSAIISIDDDSMQSFLQISSSPIAVSPLTPSERTSTSLTQSYSTQYIPSQSTPSAQPASRMTPSPTAPSESELPRKKKKTSENLDSDIIFSEAVDAFKKLCGTKKEKIKSKELDPLHGFSKMIIATISGMSAPKQAKAMQKITELVMQIKFEPENRI